MVAISPSREVLELVNPQITATSSSSSSSPRSGLRHHKSLTQILAQQPKESEIKPEAVRVSSAYLPKPAWYKKAYWKLWSDGGRQLEKDRGSRTEQERQAERDLVRQCGTWAREGSGVDPSDLFLDIYGSVLQTLNTDPRVGLVSPSLLGVTGTVPLTVISLIPDIIAHHATLITKAQHEVLLFTNYWQPSNSQRSICQALKTLSGRLGKEITEGTRKGDKKIIVKLVYDRGTIRQFINRHSPVPPSLWPSIDLPLPDEIPNLDMQVLNYHRPLVGTFHSKFLVVDRSAAILCSNNIQDRPNLEMMVHLEGEIVQSLYDTALISFASTLKPTLPLLSLPPPTLPDIDRMLFQEKNPWLSEIPLVGAAEAARRLIRLLHKQQSKDEEQRKRENAPERGRMRNVVRGMIERGVEEPVKESGPNWLEEIAEAVARPIASRANSRANSRGPSRRGSFDFRRSLPQGPLGQTHPHQHTHKDTLPDLTLDTVISNAASPPVTTRSPVFSEPFGAPSPTTVTTDTTVVGHAPAITSSDQVASPAELAPPLPLPLLSDSLSSNSFHTTSISQDAHPADSPSTPDLLTPAESVVDAPYVSAIINKGDGHQQTVDEHVHPRAEGVRFANDGEEGMIDRSSNLAVGTDASNKEINALAINTGAGDKKKLNRLEKMSEKLNAGVLSEPKPTVEDSDAIDQFMPHIFHDQHRPVPMCLVNRGPRGLPGHQNLRTPQNAAWLGAFRFARKKIFIQTPTFNARPAVEAALDACRRGIEVTLYLGLGFNDKGESIPFQGGTNQEVAIRMYRQLNKERKAELLKIFWYVGKDQSRPLNAAIKQRNCHIKLCIVDDHVGMCGNGNQDTQSWFHSQEVNVLIDSAQICSDWMQALTYNQNTHLYGRLDAKDGIWRDEKGRTVEDLDRLKQASE
ncbi:Phospholipase D/Transphosphatidylase [Phaffia rhodozyma]|uniref:Phospholipase D/Transphosphatidylase n=1 Tax=Phaffia rhodozyma TaxID=264483 RepID=A0A0F7SHH0_PHARH|nr:Phospholipase D/Transphosphatidylase [Phaffia rhodozyma]